MRQEPLITFKPNIRYSQLEFHVSWSITMIQVNNKINKKEMNDE